MSVMIKRLSIVFNEPDSHDPQAYLAEIARLIEGFSDETQAEAADQVLSTHRGRMWPTPAQCVAACRDVTERKASQQPQTKYTFPSQRAEYDAKTKERWRLAKEWRDQCIAEYGSMEAYYNATRHMPRIDMFGNRQEGTSGGGAVPLGSVTRTAFKAMQQASRNSAHTTRKKPASDTLTETSKRMTGDHE